MFAALVSPPSDVENDEGIEALEACDGDDAATSVEVGPLASALLWQLTGTATGVASTAAIKVVVSMVRERLGNAG